jgi:broad specificity phosphatase PhoE
VGVVGVGVGVGVAVGVGLVEVFVGGGLVEAAGGWTGSHDSALPDVAAVAAAALPAAAARTPPEATVTSTLPAARVTAVRRARAELMSMSRPIVRRVAEMRPTVEC